MYNLSCYEGNITNTLQMTQCSNDVSGGIFFPLIFMFVGFIILFISFKTLYETIPSFMTASFIIGIVGVMGWFLDMVNNQIVFIPIFMLVASVIAYALSD